MKQSFEIYILVFVEIENTAFKEKLNSYHFTLGEINKYKEEQKI